MKHLGLFESYLDKYYQEIDKDEFHTDLNEQSVIDINIVIKLKKIGFEPTWPYKDSNTQVLEKSVSSTKYTGWERVIKSIGRFSFIPTNEDTIVLIYQIPDDYFIVKATYQESIKTTNNYIPNVIRYWKCDQFEGLKKLLSDNKWDQ